ncbi:MAG: hypothetical protein DSZ28_07560 [Thiothrix sp.]|nr:MAG: hypothetical protein DSZ28_07560 [Thiothrix sp.]
MKHQDFSLDSASEQKVTLKRQAIRTSAVPKKAASKSSSIKSENRRDMRYLLGLGVGLLFVLGLSLYSLSPRGMLPVEEGSIAKDQIDESPPLSQTAETVAASEVPLVEAVAVVEPSASDASDSPLSVESNLADGENARSVISDLKRQDKAPNMEVLFNQAEQYHAAGNPTDAYLLYFYLAKKGHGPSAMALAVTSDPIYYTRSGALNSKPDPFQAFKWYRHAVKAGVPQAQQNLDKLKENIEAVALSGDKSAQRLLLQWQ